MNTVPESIPDNIKICLFEYQRYEWEKVFETSMSGKISENQPETQLHWETVSGYAIKQIDEIDKELQQLKHKVAIIQTH